MQNVSWHDSRDTSERECAGLLKDGFFQFLVFDGFCLAQQQQQQLF